MNSVVRKDAINSSRGHAIGCFIFLLVVAALLWRLPIGIDFSDESYYAIFIDDWLKGDIVSSTLNTLHQTAMLGPYFLIRFFYGVGKSPEGLLFILRVFYFFGSIVAALAWLSLFLRLCRPLSAWLCASFALAFIPFSLPAVSYNTLAIQGLAIALVGLGHGMIGSRAPGLMAVMSALGWAIAVTAYPPLIASLAFCLILLVSIYGLSRQTLVYSTLVIGGQILAWSLIAAILSPTRLLESVTYLTAINEVGGWQRKITYSAEILRTHPVFLAVCFAAILVGLSRQYLGSFFSAVMTLLLVSILFFEPYALFCRSHDVVTVLALTGVGLIFRIRKLDNSGREILAILWTVAMAASIAITLSATNSIINFPVGAAAAAAISLATIFPKTSRDEAVLALAQAGSIAGVLATTLVFYYGTLPNASRPQTGVASGPFKGLLGEPVQIQLIQWMSASVAPLVGADKRIAFVGRFPGLILMTTARPSMMSVYPLDKNISSDALLLTNRFFDDPDHRPGLVVEYADVHFIPINPIGSRFLEWYEPIDGGSHRMDGFKIYRLRREQNNGKRD